MDSNRYRKLNRYISSLHDYYRRKKNEEKERREKEKKDHFKPPSFSSERGVSCYTLHKFEFKKKRYTLSKNFPKGFCYVSREVA